MAHPNLRTLWIFLALVAVNSGGSPSILGKTPPMGWNSWNHFNCDISEDTILSAAQALVDSGLNAVGYEYVIIDDCWHAPSRDNVTNAPLADPIKFPNGINRLADRIHDLGLKFGIYSDAGSKTCGGRFGSLGYEEIDAKTYAEWGVDYLKYDNCFNEGLSGSREVSFERYATMSRALNSTGRPIFYAICNWGEDSPWEWAGEIGQSWRISGDIYDNFDDFDSRCPCLELKGCTNFGHHCAATRIIDWAAPLSECAGPGKWNDLDMLEVGNGHMSYDEYVSHFSLWAILKSPLILGNDLTRMTEETLGIISNREVIRINQDPLGIPAKRVWKVPAIESGDLQLWVGPLAKSQLVVAVLNTSPFEAMLTISSDHLGLSGSVSYEVHDLWVKGDSWAWSKNTAEVHVSVRSHHTKVWRFVPARDEGLVVQS